MVPVCLCICVCEFVKLPTMIVLLFCQSVSQSVSLSVCLPACLAVTVKFTLVPLLATFATQVPNPSTKPSTHTFN